MAIPEGIQVRSLGEILLSVEGGVSVNSESRLVRTGELGVLMTSAVTYGVFDPTAHKAVIPDDIERARRPVRAGTVLFSRMNTPHLVGATVFVDRDFPFLFLPDRLWELVPRESVNARWLSFVLSDSQTRRVLSELASGTSGSMKNISKEKLLSVSIRVPPLPEQKKIATILSSVDETIAKTESVIAQLQIVKKAMMEQLLTKGMPGRHTRFKQTEIGEIPEEWEVVRLGDVCDTRSGGTPDRQRSEYWNGPIPWVKTGEVNYAEIYSTEEFISEAGLRNSAAQLFPIGTVLMAMYGQGATRGRVAILGISAATNQACLGLFVSSSLSSSYLYQWLKSQYETLRSIGNEGSQKNLNAALIRDLRIPLPPKEEQLAIAKCVASLDQRELTEETTRCHLQNLKSALSSSLLSGEIRVVPGVA